MAIDRPNIPPTIAARPAGNLAISSIGLIVRALRNPNYAVYVAGNSVSLIGTWMQRIGVGWLTWELTQSHAWLGLVAFADLFPSVFFGPIGGAIADRVDRLRIIRTSQVLAMLQAATLFVLTWTGTIDIALLFALVLVNGIVIGFNQPSRLALISSLVPKQDLGTAVAINSIVFNLARFVGPALAGALIVSGGTAAVFGANAVTFLAFLLALTRIRLPRAERAEPAEHRRSVLGDVADGIRYTARHPGVGPLLLLLTINSLTVRPFVELLPGFAADVFDRGADGLALMTSAIGGGAIVAGLWLARREGLRGLTHITLGSTILLSVSTLAFIASGWFPLALACLAVSGMGLVASGVTTQTLVQTAADPRMRGRVLSLYGIIFRGGPAAGALAIGVLSDAIGLEIAMGIGAVAGMIAWLWAWRRRRAMAAALEPPHG
ncbi:MFS transporter [Stella sp.]|uniref:MFS transporter n=1 Tax=Stella sp. TaxID=2912054 RepID=UPI0035B4EA3C